MEAAKNALHESRTEFYLAKQQLERAQEKFESWQRPAKQHHDWQNSPEGKQMHEAKAILEIPSVRERLEQVQRQLKIELGLQILQDWQQKAIHLVRPDKYVARIGEVRDEFRQSGVVSEEAVKAMSHDLNAYEQLPKPKHSALSR